MTTNIDSPAEATKASPEALLKAAVSGGKPTESKATETRRPAPTAAKAGRRLDGMAMGLAGAALALGTVLGAGTAMLATPRSEGTGIVLAEIDAALEANRLEASRLAIASDRLDKSVAALKEVSEAARSEAKARGGALTEKVGKTETALVAKIAALGERIDQAEKEQAARLAATTAQAEKRTVAAATAPAPVPAPHRPPRRSRSRPEASPRPSRSPRSSSPGRCATFTTAPPCWRTAAAASSKSRSGIRSPASAGSRPSSGAGGNGSW